MKKASVPSVLVAVTLFVVGMRAEAQKPKLYRVGVLPQPGSLEELPRIKGLRDGLANLGYIEAKTLQLNIPKIKMVDELRPIANTYIENRVDVILSIGGTATSIAKEATKDLPIVFMAVSADPVEMGFVKSLARPETNLTGLTSTTGSEFEGKRLELFKEIVPNLRRLVLLYNARGDSPGHAMRVAQLREVAPKLGIKLNERPVKSVADVDEALRTFSKQIADGIFIIGSGLFREPCRKIVTVAIAKKIPLWGCERQQSFLSSYSADEHHYGHSAAWYVDKILQGAKPTDLPVKRPIKFVFIINLKTATQIGLTIPSNVLAKADRVIK